MKQRETARKLLSDAMKRGGFDTITSFCKTWAISRNVFDAMLHGRMTLSADVMARLQAAARGESPDASSWPLPRTCSLLTPMQQDSSA